MTKLKIALLFISIFLLRWYTLPSALPKDWKNESEVKYSVTVLTKPEYSDTQTIVQSGIWYIVMPGYMQVIPGDRVSFVGTVEPKMTMGKVTQIVMREPKVEEIKHSRSVGALHSGSVIITLGNWREKWVTTLQKNLPEPMASLAAGILLGIKAQIPQDFYEALSATGTLHIIAASGYNVAIVASVLMVILGKFTSKKISILMGLIGILLYVLISGGTASVIRAGIMGSLTLIAYYFGRPAEARRLLWMTIMIMLIVSPLMIVDVGFQLSAMATIGLLYIGGSLERVGESFVSIVRLPSGINIFLAEYLYPTLKATISTLPIILWHFGRISWISPIVNMLILPFIPIIMLLTALTIVVASFSWVLGQLVAWLTYVPLAWMVWVIRFSGKIL